MKLNSIIAAAVLTVGSMGAAEAAVYNYSFGGANANFGADEYFAGVGGAPGVTVAAYASGLLNNVAELTRSAGGLGVKGSPDTQPWEIDGNPVGSNEWVTLTFDWAVNLLSFTLNNTEGDTCVLFLCGGGDQYDVSINGGSWVNGLTASALNPVGVNYVTSIGIRASGSFIGDLDDFKLAGVQVASVPLPAGGLLLGGGLGALALLRRKRKTA